MEKRISFYEFQSVKSVAKACDPIMRKRDKVKAQIEKLAKEYKEYDTQIQTLEAGIKQIMGFRVEELVKKVIEPGVDKNGKETKTTKYLPTDMVVYDEATKQFVINVPDADATVVPPTIEDNNGSDLDKDAEQIAQEENKEEIFG